MKKYTMEDFIAGKVNVLVGRKHCKAFLDICEKHHLRWFSGSAACKFTPDLDCYGDGTTICHNSFGFGRLSYGDSKEIQSRGRIVVDYEAFMGESAPARYKIIIESDGHTTKGTMTVNGKEIKTSNARLHPSDKFDWKTGARFAFERLWDRQYKPAEEAQKPAVREVKRHAKQGEYIKIVNAESGNEENYRNGDILLVTKYYDGIRDGWVDAKGASVVISPEEYVVLEGYKP